MQAKIKLMRDYTEFETSERCFITEVSNDVDDQDLSIAKARVEPGVVTAWHKLTNVHERYIIIQGSGLVEIGDLPPTPVSTGDVVRIPETCPQRITNIGHENLIFYAICTPRFTSDCYVDLETDEEYLPFEAPCR